MDCSADCACLPPYAELHCISNFTFLRGASHPEELVARAKVLGYRAIAITDECSLSGIVRAHVAARVEGIDLLVGSEFRLQEGWRFLLLATDRGSYGRLAHLITLARRQAKKGEYFIDRNLVRDHCPAGCLAIWLPCFNRGEIETNGLRWLAGLFPGALWIAVESLLDGNDREQLRRLQEISAGFAIPLCACGDVHIHGHKRRIVQDTLTAIRLGKPLSELGYGVYSNGERHLRSRRRLAQLYPRPLLEETVRIADRCRFSLDELRYEYPSELVPKHHTPGSWLRLLTEQGMQTRWPGGAPEKVRALVEHELALVQEFNYEHYFLTVHDIVKFARSKGILCQGRGSAANSATCYCLGITEVNPDAMDLLFERFISRERNEPPDIDVDFEHERREEVIAYIYEKYGRERAALAATVITYRPKSALRDVGKALGMSTDQLERLAASVSGRYGNTLETAQLDGFPADSPLVRRLVYLVNNLIGFPRHLSQHVGGFVISQGLLSHLVPVENAAMPGRTVIQWEKDDLEALGLLKVDVLSLGMLTAIRKALALVSQYRNELLTLDKVPTEDPAVYKMMQKADTVGVFQIESRAQMSMLPRLKPENYYDLVIQIAIVRPGPIQGDMVHPYLRRRRGEEPVIYPGKAVEKVLKRTLGVPIFQEQVMQLAMVAAGFSAGEADQLRRCMAAWHRKGGLEPFEKKLLSGMKARGYPESFARQIFNQIKGFGEYGFPESHSASFALLAYVSSWLKYYHPAAFTCALLNSQPLGFYRPAQLVQDARRHGVTVLPVDVNDSNYDCTLEGAPGQAGTPGTLRLGLRLVKGLSRAGAHTLALERKRGRYVSAQDIAARTGLDQADLTSLADADALNGIGKDRHRACWEVLDPGPGAPLFSTPDEEETDLMLRKPREGENILADYASIGFTLRRHPLALLRGRLDKRGVTTSTGLRELADNAWARAAGIVTSRQRPATSSGVMFFTLEDETGFINAVIWPSIFAKQGVVLTTAKLLEISGAVQKQDGVLHLIARQCTDLSSWLGDMQLKSRDFC